MSLKTIQALASELQDVRGEIAAFEESMRPLKDREEELRERMLAALKKDRLSSFKTEDGMAYVRAFRTSYAITDPAKALAWANENGCAKVDTAKLSKALRGNAQAIPDGFDYSETEYLTIKSAVNQE